MEQQKKETKEQVCTICKSKIQEKRCPICGTIMKDKFKVVCEACEWESYL
jgi:hypothetical protein